MGALWMEGVKQTVFTATAGLAHTRCEAAPGMLGGGVPAPVSSQPTAPECCIAAAKTSKPTALLPCKMSRRLPRDFHPNWACSLRGTQGEKGEVSRTNARTTAW